MLTEIARFQSLYNAFERARRGHRGDPCVLPFYRELDTNLLALQTALLNGTFQPDPYRYFAVHHAKERLVAAASFRDRVLHHALMAATEAVFEPHLSPHSYACRRGFGQHAATCRVRALARRYPFALRLDIRRYFDHIDHDRLLALLGVRISDADVLALCARLLDSAGVPGVAPGARRGVPIGNLTSQIWANIYLDPLDHFVEDANGIATYTRYMDDIVVFANDKLELWQTFAAARDFVGERLGLVFKASATRVMPVSDGVPWLGLRIFPRMTRLDNAGKRRLIKKLRECDRRVAADPRLEPIEAQRAASLLAHANQAATLELRRSLFDHHFRQ